MAKTIQCDMLQKPVLKIGLVCGAIVILATTHYLRNMFLLQTLDTSSFLNAIDIDSQRGNLVLGLKPEVSTDYQNVFKGNTTEIRNVKDDNEIVYDVSDEGFLQKTVNCTWVREYFSNNLYTTKLEESFPIAFTFLIHNSAHQVIRLLKLLYRPHNQYCIAIDKKSNVSFINIFSNIAKCLDNIHVASKLLEVKWGHISIIQSQMQCYSDLLKVRKKQAVEQRWKYVINLCGKELPLNSNHEIVSHLVRLNGTSAVGARKIPSTEGGTYSRLKNQSIPHSLPLYKSMTYMSVI